MLEVRLMVKVASLIAASLVALVISSFLASFASVPVDIDRYQERMSRYEELHASGTAVTPEEVDALFPEQQLVHTTFGSFLMRSLAWRPWVSIVAALIAFCAFRSRFRDVIVATPVVSGVLLLIGQTHAAMFFAAGAAAYLLGLFLVDRATKGRLTQPK